MLGHGWCEWRVAWRRKVNDGEVEWIGKKKGDEIYFESWKTIVIFPLKCCTNYRHFPKDIL